MHIFKPSIFNFLDEKIEKRQPNVLLTPVLQELADAEKYLALEIKGTRYDTSKKLGLLQAQIALGLAGNLKDEMLTSIIQIMADSAKTKQ